MKESLNSSVFFPLAKQASVRSNLKTTAKYIISLIPSITCDIDEEIACVFVQIYRYKCLCLGSAQPKHIAVDFPSPRSSDGVSTHRHTRACQKDIFFFFFIRNEAKAEGQWSQRAQV